MPTTFTEESKPTTGFTKEYKPGRPADSGVTWDDLADPANETWDTYPGTWDSPGLIAATSFTKESKPTTSITKETKP